MPKGNYKFNWPLVGNTQITQYLEKSIINNNAAGAYIFTGPDNLGKTTVANFFAQSLLCENKKPGAEVPCGVCGSCRSFRHLRENNDPEPEEDGGQAVHSDFHIVKRSKDKKNISVEDIRKLIKILSLSSFLNSYKIGIVKHADTMSEGAFNALLKTLEEPKNKVVIILVARTLDSLPATIVSRSQLLRFRPVKGDIIYDYLIKDHKASRSAAKNFSQLSLGRPALAVKFLENKDFYDNYKEKVEVFLRFIGLDINGRLDLVGKIIEKKLPPQEAVKKTKRTLEVWQGVIRDWLLLEYGFNNLIQNQIAEADILRLKKIMDINRTIKLIKMIGRAEEFLKANVNPTLVLQNIAVQI